MGNFNEIRIDLKVIEEIIKRGNTAEIRPTKEGIAVIEVKRNVADRK